MRVPAVRQGCAYLCCEVGEGGVQSLAGMMLMLSDIHSQEQRIWCWVTPCIVPVNRGLMPWRKHPNPGLFGDQRGFLCV